MGYRQNAHITLDTSQAGMRLLILLGAIAAGVWSQVPAGKSALGRDPPNPKFYEENHILNIYKS